MLCLQVLHFMSRILHVAAGFIYIYILYIIFIKYIVFLLVILICTTCTLVTQSYN